jgi:TctA family transporter
LLLPIILLFCVLGSYAINGSYFDVGIMLGMGLLGFVLERRQVPLGPVVLGIILGGPLEERFFQTLVAAGGSPLGLLGIPPGGPYRPVATVLAVVCILIWIAPAVLLAMRRNVQEA